MRVQAGYVDIQFGSVACFATELPLSEVPTPSRLQLTNWQAECQLGWRMEGFTPLLVRKDLLWRISGGVQYECPRTSGTPMPFALSGIPTLFESLGAGDHEPRFRYFAHLGAA